MSIEKQLPKIKENVSLREHTTFKIGGNARYFYIAENSDDLIKAIKTAKEYNIPFFVLGGGSNVLFSDNGFNGLVIRIKNNELKIINNEIYVEGGIKLDDLVRTAEKESLAGIEWLAGIPGTVGGAIYGNAQAFNNRMSDIVESVEVLDIDSLEIKKFSNKECEFSLKSSIFKENKRLIIVSAIFKLEKGNQDEIKEKIKRCLDYRKENHPLNFPSAGSVFVNRELKLFNPIEDSELLKECPELEDFNKKGFIPSGYLIEKCGLKGKKIGDAQISEKHAGFIINLGKAKAEDVLKLIKLAKQKVKEKFKIELKEEIIYVDTK